jgi:murein endopeptidase
LLAALLGLIAVPAAGARTDTAQVVQETVPQIPVEWRESTPAGLWWAGRLRRGVQLPAEGIDWFTWDPVLKRRPNRGWRRWGTDRLVRTVIDVLALYRIANPFAPRVGIGDLSRRHGGEFGRRFGGLGHASHQNGLDVDVYYPRIDGLERRPYKPSQVDLALAQELVDRFVAAGAITIYTGPRLALRGPRRIVAPLVHHDDHLHVRIGRGR